MLFESFDHKSALIFCQERFDLAPYNLMGDGIHYVAQQIEHGDCCSYKLMIPIGEANAHETLLDLIEYFAKGVCRNSEWKGLPDDSLYKKVTARRNIDYYRLNLIERIGLIDTDVSLGNEDGTDNDTEIQALFPELAFSKNGDNVEITVHLPNRH